MSDSLLPPDGASDQVPNYHSIFFGQYPEALIKRGKYSDIWFNPDGQYNLHLMQWVSSDTFI